MKRGLGEELWREKENLAWLDEDTAYAEEAADFGCVVGDGD